MGDPISPQVKAKSQGYSPQEGQLSLLKNRAKILRGLCHRIDPFREISHEDRELLAELGDFDYRDPFSLTNRLILMTEDTLEEIRRMEGGIPNLRP